MLSFSLFESNFVGRNDNKVSKINYKNRNQTLILASIIKVDIG